MGLWGAAGEGVEGVIEVDRGLARATSRYVRPFQWHTMCKTISQFVAAYYQNFKGTSGDNEAVL